MTKKVAKAPKKAAKPAQNKAETPKSTPIAKSHAVNLGGRPSDFREEFIEQAHKLALLGATDAEYADFFHVVEATINTWKQKHPKFLDSIKAGRDKADAEIANSLFHRAKGYSHRDVHISNYQGIVTQTPIIKHYPPDTVAASLWLRNRQPAKWRDKVESEIYGKDGGPIRSQVDINLSPDEAYKTILG